ERMIETELIVQDAYHKLDKNTQALKKLKEMSDRKFDKELLEFRKKLGSDEKVQDWLRLQGLTLETFRKKQERLYVGNTYRSSRIGPFLEKIGHPEVEEYYLQPPNEFQTADRVEWQDLFLAVGPRHPTLQDARRFAEQLLARLRAGENFTSLLEYD